MCVFPPCLLCSMGRCPGCHGPRSHGMDSLQGGKSLPGHIFWWRGLTHKSIHFSNIWQESLKWVTSGSCTCYMRERIFRWRITSWDFSRDTSWATLVIWYFPLGPSWDPSQRLLKAWLWNFSIDLGLIWRVYLGHLSTAIWK